MGNNCLVLKLERILVVDDDGGVRTLMTDLLRERDYAVLGVSSLAQARTALAEQTHDLVICDLRLGDGNGLDFLQTIKKEYPQMRSMVMTGFGSLDSAVQALRIGVFDYLIKPIDDGRLAVALERLQAVMDLEAENVYLRREMAQRDGNLISWGESPGMKRVQELVDRICKTRATVLIQGESGTGKEVVAHALHKKSPWAEQPFIRVNCAAIPATLLESEFFGHEKGAFTGAVQRREGRFELAHGGTLLLDEISEIPPDLQVKLLRVLQELEFERVGGNKTIKVDVRVLATTNRDLLEYVQQGKFREDLYYRLNVVPLHLPPLRERGDDVIHLAGVFVVEFSRKHGKKTRKLSREAVLRIKAYHWPGNVRELQNAIERAVILSEEEEELSAVDLPDNTSAVSPVAGQEHDPIVPLLVMERRLIERTLQRCGGNRTHAAEILGISVRTLRNKLAEYRSTNPAEPA